VKEAMMRIRENWWFRDLGWLVAASGLLLILAAALLLLAQRDAAHALRLNVDAWPVVATIVFTSFFLVWWLLGYWRDRTHQIVSRPAMARAPVRTVQKADMRHARKAA